ncbi:hypothetical protein GGI26_005975 [Coemansia sp. RSA 1358]|nr:hypothetical protein EDC05_004145 [Coemansia umbellata]KAJ2619264.1 hypothetical protein GGI26_005975 [Coemansia sp. RSA 1358]
MAAAPTIKASAQDIPNDIDSGLFGLQVLASDSDSESVNSHTSMADVKKVTRRLRNEAYQMNKRRERAYATFIRMEGLSSVEEVFDKNPQQAMCIINIGFGDIGGATTEQIESVFGQFGGFEHVVSKHGKPYTFVVFKTADAAQAAYAKTYGKLFNELCDKPLLLEYLNQHSFKKLLGMTLGEYSDDCALDESRGLYYIADFITKEEEQSIMQYIRKDEEQEATNNGGPTKWLRVQKRYVKHYGHSFDYHIKHVGDASLAASQSLPSWMWPFIERMKQKLLIYADQTPNQLTIQRYPTGAGISFHTDSHTSFTDIIMILSMGTPVQMDFQKPESGATMSLDLEPRSLVLMAGEARYGWQHAIHMRRSDLVAGRVRERSERWSITMRTINKRMACNCAYPELCDTNEETVQRLRKERGIPAL